MRVKSNWDPFRSLPRLASFLPPLPPQPHTASPFTTIVVAVLKSDMYDAIVRMYLPQVVSHAFLMMISRRSPWRRRRGWAQCRRARRRCRCCRTGGSPTGVWCARALSSAYSLFLGMSLWPEMGSPASSCCAAAGKWLPPWGRRCSEHLSLIASLKVQQLIRCKRWTL
jgi:hypothetical protein